MSTPLALQVPAPTVSFKAVAGSFAPLEGALSLSFPSVSFSDGSAMTADDLAGAQALLSRTLTAGSLPELWDPDTRTWRAAGGLDLTTLNGVPLVPPTTPTAPWNGTLVGAGQKDAAGAPQIQAASAHFPQYRIRGAFRAKRNGIEAAGVGPESAPVEFASSVTAARFGAELTPDTDTATRVQLVLRDAAARPVGVLDIDASGGTAVVTLANLDASGGAIAKVRLEADGTIRLTPSSGHKVIVAGDLETEGIRYLPSTGLPKKDLT